MDSKLESRSKGRAFESYTRWKWSQSKVNPILVHSIIEEKKFESSQMGHTKKNRIYLKTTEVKSIAN